MAGISYAVGQSSGVRRARHECEQAGHDRAYATTRQAMTAARKGNRWN